MVQNFADQAYGGSGGDHFHHGIDTHKGADKYNDILAADQPLHIRCIAEEQHQCQHEQDCIQQCRTETGNESGNSAVGQLFNSQKNKPGKQTGQKTGHKPLNKGQERVDTEQDYTHGAGTADAEALQKA